MGLRQIVLFIWFFILIFSISNVRSEESKASSNSNNEPKNSFDTKFCEKVITYFQRESKKLNFVDFAELIRVNKIKESLREKEFTPEEINAHVHGLENSVPTTPISEDKLESTEEEPPKKVEPYVAKILDDNHTPQSVCNHLFDTYVSHCSEQLKDVMSGRQVASLQSKKYKIRKILKRKNLNKESIIDEVLNYTENYDWEGICIIFTNHIFNGDKAFYSLEDDDDEEEREKEWKKLKKEILKIKLEPKEDL